MYPFEGGGRGAITLCCSRAGWRRASAALRFRADQGHGSVNLTRLLLKLQQAGAKWRPSIGGIGTPAAIIKDVNRRAVLALRQPAHYQGDVV